MNAYELADELKACIDDGSTDLVCVCGAVNMLRQQADRIAELEKQSEPVAWIRSGDDQLSLVKEKDDGYMVLKPLYLAPQTKPLSDEEIIKIFNKIWVAGGNTNGVMHRFARAIEERHGIK